MNDDRCAYFTRNLETQLRERLHAMTRRLRAAGHRASMEDIVNQALELGLYIMEARHGADDES